ncbi:hisA/hisF family protein [Burkholderiales bacterium JOSHI_001]|nr:hisA/hisF family protein [Burkholderiales bacterium JOSHI_001]
MKPIVPEVIPVLDLLHGQVVRAVRGQRSSYRPIVTPLVAGSAPVDVAAALRHCTGSNTLYVADLDAIVEGRAQVEVLRQLLAADPQRSLWLDAGFKTEADLAALRAGLGELATRMRPVLGSESLASLRALQMMTADPRAILSLDCRQQQPMDPAGVWQQPALWPDTVIVMTLDRVGAASGPDLQRFAELQALKPHATWVGAGGIRHASDLAQAGDAGAAAWLVASALHDGTLAPAKATA